MAEPANRSGLYISRVSNARLFGAVLPSSNSVVRYHVDDGEGQECTHVPHSEIERIQCPGRLDEERAVLPNERCASSLLKEIGERENCKAFPISPLKTLFEAGVL